jgi:hypothetical protein
MPVFERSGNTDDCPAIIDSTFLITGPDGSNVDNDGESLESNFGV